MAKPARMVQEAVKYGVSRPAYSKSVRDIILNYVSKTGGGFDRAVDLACGSGQSTFYLSESFQRCTGIDVSPEQIRQARSLCRKLEVTNTEFEVAEATDLPIDDGCADLVTIATGWHWIMDKDRLYSECKRVLKPRGSLAVYAHDLVQTKDAAVNELIHAFYAKQDPYWHPDLNHVKNECRDVVLPFSETQRLQAIMRWRTSLPGLMGYLSSWPSYRSYLRACPGAAAFNLQQLSQRIEDRLDKIDCRSSPTQQRRIRANHFHPESLDTFFPVYLVLGQNCN